MARLLVLFSMAFATLFLAGGEPARAQTMDWPARYSTAQDTTDAVETSPVRQVKLAIRQASDRTGVDYRYLLAKAQIESGLNAQAKARNSSATGLFQFIERTARQS